MPERIKLKDFEKEVKFSSVLLELLRGKDCLTDSDIASKMIEEKRTGAWGTWNRIRHMAERRAEFQASLGSEQARERGENIAYARLNALDVEWLKTSYLDHFLTSGAPTYVGSVFDLVVCVVGDSYMLDSNDDNKREDKDEYEVDSIRDSAYSILFLLRDYVTEESLDAYRDKLVQQPSAS